MSIYEQVAQAIREAKTDTQLRLAWVNAQPLLKQLNQAAVAALVAMKDHRKNLIANGSVHDYDAARARAAAIDWNGPEGRAEMERAREQHRKNMERIRGDLHKTRGGKRRH